MIVKMFKPRFAALVKAGTKKQTIRPIPKRMPKVGDKISLRQWSGRPYWSEQILLCESTITSVFFIGIVSNNAYSLEKIIGPWKGKNYFNTIAKMDGFKNWVELREWFKAEHGLPFEGIVIRWL